MFGEKYEENIGHGYNINVLTNRFNNCLSNSNGNKDL